MYHKQFAQHRETDREELQSIIEDKMMRLLESCDKLILKTPVSQKITFKLEIHVMEHKCQANAVSMDEWL